MSRVGIGGVQNFDASVVTPRVVDPPIPYLTPEWREAFREAVTLADEKGLEFAIASSPGWNATGGPWVQPEQAMKKLVWTETVVEGGQRFTGVLTQPPSVAGPFANVTAPIMTREPIPLPDLYRDQVVIAYQAPDADRTLNHESAIITSSAGPIDTALLSDGDVVTPVSIAFGDSERTWVQFAFDHPVEARAVTLGLRKLALGPAIASDPEGLLEASDDGVSFRAVATLPSEGFYQTTIAFPVVRARYFRVSFPADRTPPTFGSLGADFGMRMPPRTSTDISELVLHGGARIAHFEHKVGFTHEVIAVAPIEVVDESACLRRRDVIDLTQRMRADGSLDWSPPAGRWVVLRFGYSLTGKVNGPASREGTGLEVDKLNRQHVKAYADAYLGEYERALGPDLIGRRGLQYMLSDSFEAGAQNWTDGMLDKFRERRGYDLRPWMPALAGRVVESAEASERVLWDFRQTLSELLADEHFGQLSASLHERRMGRYGEAHEWDRAFTGDGMAVRKSADIPMAAMWVSPQSPNANEADIHEAASVAHIYGQNLVACEALTTAAPPFSLAPQDLKPTADRMFVYGVNRVVIHTSAHQPSDRLGPGLTLGRHGQWFTRKETWAELAGPWVSYLARTSHLLQQGLTIADVLYFYGEDANVTALFSETAPPIPEGYNFDYANADVLLNEVRVRNGTLRTRTGMSYRLLAIDPSVTRMSMPVLRKLHDLASAGVTIVGAKPTRLANLDADPERFGRLADSTWRARSVRADFDLAAALTDLGVAPDFTYAKPQTDTRLQYLHRTLAVGDLYFVINRNDRAQSLETSFRVTGMAPELWRADTGAVSPLSYRIENGRTIVPLTLEPNDAVFVVFRELTSASTRTLAPVGEREVDVLSGPWTVAFPVGSSVSKTVQFERLESWTEQSDPDVKYFSGTATYHRTMDWRENAPNERVVLDLGEVKNLAEVVVNGRSMGVAWKPPFRVDITEAMRLGANDIEVRVVNLWPNRLIGDKQPGAGPPRAWTTFDRFYRAESPLLPSGLLGPVRIFMQTRSEAE